MAPSCSYLQGNSREVAEKFAEADPYVTSGAVKRWYVREWTTVAGKDAATPVRRKARTTISGNSREAGKLEENRSAREEP